VGSEGQIKVKFEKPPHGEFWMSADMFLRAQVAAKSLTISGTTGPDDYRINGRYVLQDSLWHGKPQWRRAFIDDDLWLVYVPKRSTWNVQSTEDKAAGDGGGFMESSRTHEADPTMVHDHDWHFRSHAGGWTRGSVAVKPSMEAAVNNARPVEAPRPAVSAHGYNGIPCGRETLDAIAEVEQYYRQHPGLDR
jgi:hypothetical protein